MFVMWDEPIMNGGDPHLIYALKCFDPALNLTLEFTNLTETSYELKGLTLSHIYEISVAAASSAGLGDFSAPITRRLLMQPFSPSGLREVTSSRGSSSVKLVWQKTGSLGGADVATYAVFFMHNG